MKNGTAGKRKGIVRRFLAKALALTMVFGLLAPAPAMTLTAYASEMAVEDLGERSCSSTLGVIQSSKSFDIQGKRTENTTYTTGSSSFNTSYRNNGYQTYIAVNDGDKKSIQCNKNGGVQEPDGMGVEVKMTVLPSPDNKYLFVNYYVYNKDAQVKEVNIGSCADIQIDGHSSGSGDPADAATLYKTDAGFHMLNYSNYSSFDCYTSENITGMPAPTTRWIGYYGSRSENIFKDSTESSVSNTDSGLAYSWSFELRPYETVQRRVAFACRVNSYYVSSQYGDDGNEGTYTKPYKTLSKAIGKIGNNKGYIYVMDYEPFTSALTLSGSDSTDITIASTDFTHEGKSTLNLPAEERIKTLERDTNYAGELFHVTGGKWSFNDITLSGSEKESASPVISVTAGRLEINSGATVTGAKGSATDKGSAIDLSGSASLAMNGGSVTGNTSAKDGRGAVHFNSTGTFAVLNAVKISGNKDTENKAANVYLPAGKLIAVEGDLEGSEIGVTTATLPEITVGGAAPTAPGQEVVVAVPSASYPGGVTTCPFSDSFKADQSAKGLTVNVGTDTDTFHNIKNAVLRRSGYTMSFVYVDDKGTAVSGAENRPEKPYGEGAAVDEAAPAPAPGYTLTGVSVNQGSGTALTPVMSGSDMGKITGNMPAQDVVVTYTYVRRGSSISFHANGGTPEPAELKGNTGDSVHAVMPTVLKYGYTFEGWVKGVYDAGAQSWSLPAPPYTFERALPSHFPEEPVKYYAIFKPDTSIKFDYTVAYQNANGSITFQTGTAEKAHSVEDEITADQKAIHGYKWSEAASLLSPEKFDFYDGRGPVDIATFDSTNGHLSGRMPGQDAAVYYRYVVDYNDPSARSNFTVKHVTASGTEVFPEHTEPYYPEDDIAAHPATVYGYDLVEAKVTKGTIADDTDGHLVSAAGENFDNAWNYSGKMPNQPVEITYIYEPNGEGYRFSVNYKDNNTDDSSLRDIIEPIEDKGKQADQRVEAECKELYGYIHSTHAAVPAAPNAQFDGDHNYSAKMPADDLTVTYTYDRDPDKWVKISYYSGPLGALSHDNESPADDPSKLVSPDVKSGGSGSYYAKVLKAGGSDEGYTWEQIRKKRLVPIAKSNSEYYRFAGWFIDSNGNQILDRDNGETLLTDTQKFDGDTAVFAYFEEVPSKWVDIKFKAGDHGTLTGAATLHTRYDDTWGAIAKPAYTPEVNYLVRGWYDGSVAMQDGDALTDGKTYTIRFYPDPNVFGTNAGDVDAAGSLDEDGQGRVTAFDTKPGYKYIITDMAGKILGVQNGSITGRVIFNDLYPGTRYQVYEASGDTDAAPGGDVSGASGMLGNPTEVLVPVVEHNYQISYDTENEGKTVLTIEPADKDADYAILDESGNVVHTPESGEGGWQTPAGNPGKVVFSGLNHGGKYTVVARPKGQSGIAAEDKRQDGTDLTMDPGGELEIPKFIVQTVNGEVVSVGDNAVGAPRYDEAHRGDAVQVSAEAADGAGHSFRFWRVLVGAVSGIGSKLKNLAFSFAMPDTNVVLTAEYQRGSSSNATVTDEVRGGNPGEMALDPDEIEDLEDSLTTDADRVLMKKNKAEVIYKVVYRKGKVRKNVSDAVREFNDYEHSSHKKAYTEAWELGVDIERYVNGRRVKRTTPSNAQFNTYVQLDKEDVDMMDYALYEYRKDPADPANYLVEEVTLSEDPEESGGLFTFTARDGAHYVLTYSKAFRLTFINEHSETQPQYTFKLRKGDSPEDTVGNPDYPNGDYSQVEDPKPDFTSTEGIYYLYKGWSRRKDRMRAFDPGDPIGKRSYIYAFYEDNKKEVTEARKALDKAIQEAMRRADDFFLKRKETGEILDKINDVVRRFEQTEPRRLTQNELEDLLSELKNFMKTYDDQLDGRYKHYDDITTHRSGGGSSGGGGGRGAGTRSVPYVPENARNYVVGTNGNWELVDAEKHEWAFVLNGGIRLTSRWAKLDYANGDINRNGWYHFNSHGLMDSGWFRDEAQEWYYCDTVHDGWFGKMKTGWHYDRDDRHWYYLDPVSGKMATGWVLIDGKWYYFTTQNGGDTWQYDWTAEKWFYLGNDRRPLGSMFEDETTPDGYRVNGDGAWIR